ncbi:uncharacterized protein LOC110047078 isoform X1 [Orbicella faveolata]|uniref:uncharacterized protein LOC110047078 isoform X1 n=1 Tax=Orbicella faveolata TaxID=48498 RepID=UPI0009E5B649|nr:uncharacterized protein LOC110047078 isoform X1 [Orbicella faveolata]
MKAVLLSFLFLSIVVCKAAKFPFHLKDEQDCSFCESMHRLGDCICDDVNWCRGVQCNVAAKCDEKCRTDETPPSVIQEPEIVPVTAASVGNDSEQDCSFCENMHLLGKCNCDDVNWCRDVQCNVPAKCDEECHPE